MHSQVSLEGEEDSLFYTYWGKIKNKIDDLRNLPYSILKQIAAVKSLQEKTKVAGTVKDWPTYNFAYDSLKRLNAMLAPAIDVKNKIDKWLPTWMKKVEGERKGLSGLGAIPLIIIGVAAMGALAIVAIKGIALLKEYLIEKKAIDAVATGAISLEKAKELVGAAKTVTIAEGITRGLTAGISGALTPILLVGGAIAIGYYAFAGQIQRRLT